MTAWFQVEGPAGEIAQFEPDFDGTWEAPDPAPVRADAADDPQWIVWPEAADELAWAAVELAFEWNAAAGIVGRPG